MRGRGDSYRRIILYQRAHSYRALMGVWGIPYRRASEVEGEIPAYAGMTFGFAGMTCGFAGMQSKRDGESIEIPPTRKRKLNCGS